MKQRKIEVLIFFISFLRCVNLCCLFLDSLSSEVSVLRPLCLFLYEEIVNALLAFLPSFFNVTMNCAASVLEGLVGVMHDSVDSAIELICIAEF